MATQEKSLHLCRPLLYSPPTFFGRFMDHGLMAIYPLTHLLLSLPFLCIYFDLQSNSWVGAVRPGAVRVLASLGVCSLVRTRHAQLELVKIKSQILLH